MRGVLSQVCVSGDRDGDLVEPDGIAVDAIECVLGRNVAAAAFQRHDQLDLMVNVAACRRIGKAAFGHDERVRVLLVEEGGSLDGSWPISAAWSA